MNYGDCVICGNLRGAGEGLIIRECYVCPQCELEIAGLSIDDPDYEYYISGLKRMWRFVYSCASADTSLFLSSLARR